jgi:hypothetical protein
MKDWQKIVPLESTADNGKDAGAMRADADAKYDLEGSAVFHLPAVCSFAHGERREIRDTEKTTSERRRPPLRVSWAARGKVRSMTRCCADSRCHRKGGPSGHFAFRLPLA